MLTLASNLQLTLWGSTPSPVTLPPQKKNANNRQAYNENISWNAPEARTVYKNVPHLNLFLQAYQSHLTSERKDGSYLNGTIQLLTHTAKTIEIFTSKLSVSNSKDQRLGVLNGFHSWLERWQRDAESKNFLSTKLWFDL